MMAVLFALWTGPTGQVFAFDALPENVVVAQHNAKLNNLDNVIVRAKALSDGSGVGSANFNQGNLICSKSGVGETTVTFSRLDDEIPSSVRVDFLKIDVEGFELETMRGARRVLSNKPIIDLELHNFIHNGSVLRKIRRLLMRLGYSFYLQETIHFPPHGPYDDFDVAALSNQENPHIFCVPNVERKSWAHRALKAVKRNQLPDDLLAVANTWEALARSDPLWAILSEPGKRGRHWNCDAFFRNGEQQVKELLARAEASGALIGLGNALDFGCGVGRLSRAMASRFDKVIGIDISETMIKIARELNTDRPNLGFLLNKHNDLKILGDSQFDFVCSHITLQHIRPKLAESYIREFFRVTRPGGHVYFQIPSHPRSAGNDQSSLLNETALSPELCRAEILIRSSPAVLIAGTCDRIIAVVRNISDKPWLHRFNLGNHWLTLNGGMVQNDDGRSLLPPLVSGEAVEIALDVSAPIEPGEYRLELDLVQEGVRWFAQVGSSTTSVQVNVVATIRANESETEMPTAIVSNIDPVYKAAPAFEMHAVHRSRIESLAQEAGLKLIRCDDNLTDWVSYEYFFEKQI